MKDRRTIRRALLILAVVLMASAGIVYAVAPFFREVTATLTLNLKVPDGIEVFEDADLQNPMDLLEFGEATVDVFGSTPDGPIVLAYIHNLSFSKIRLSVDDDFEHGEVLIAPKGEDPVPSSDNIIELDPDEVLEAQVGVRVTNAIAGDHQFTVTFVAEGPVEPHDPGPPHDMEPNGEVVQELGLIEDYQTRRFYPKWMVVLRDIPLKIYLTRMHQEHVNKFTIEPFVSSIGPINPGEVGTIDFVPDQTGEFKIHNVGHGYEATLVVVDSAEEALELVKERGVQMYSLVHSLDDFKIYPETLSNYPKTSNIF